MCDSPTSPKDIPDLNYSPPKWGCPPTSVEYFIEVIKNGTVIEKIEVEPKSFLIIGRLPICDLALEHASISRYHAIIQFAEGAAFLYDLNSSHGTILNKEKIKPRVFVPLPPDSIMKFGESTRSYIFTASKREAAPLKFWENDPEKILKLWLDENGIDVEMETKKVNHEYESSIRIDSEELNLDVDFFESETGKTKKASQQALTLKVCEKLYSLGLLHDKKQNEELVYAPDDCVDIFFDRTKSRENPKRKSEMETFETLKSQMEILEANIHALLVQQKELEQKILELESQKPDDDDEMEIYLNKLTLKQIQQDLQQCVSKLDLEEAEHRRITSLFEIAKPFDWEETFSSKRAKMTEGEAVINSDKRNEKVESIHIERAPHAQPTYSVETSSSDRPLVTEEVTLNERQIFYEEPSEIEECLPPSSQDTEQIKELKRKYGY